MRRMQIAIVQGYVPQYRFAFFDGLVSILDTRGIGCVVVASERPAGTLAARRDAAPVASWMRAAKPRKLPIGDEILYYGTATHWSDCDGVIMQHRGVSIDLNAELLKKRISGRRVGLWGHIGPFTQPGHPIDLAVERWQMRRCDQVFAYTVAGRDFAVAAGIQPNKITTTMNSVGVAELLAADDSLTEVDIQEYQASYGLTPGKTFGYIGGLDEPKRIGFLAEALDIIWRKDQHIKIVVGGRGRDEKLLSRALKRGQVILIGYAGPAEKAMIGRISQAIVNPGRIGLLAVECRALGLPVLASKWKFHGPEYEYLSHGSDLLESGNSADDFAYLLLSQVDTSGETRKHDRGDYPSLDEMISNFAVGVELMLAS